jgi:hypothetical protein
MIALSRVVFGLLLLCLGLELSYAQGLLLREPGTTFSTSQPRRKKSLTIAYSHIALQTLVPTALGLAMTSNSSAENNAVGTLGGFFLIYGLCVGPSAGNFYVGDIGGGLGGIGLRSVGGGLMVMGIIFSALADHSSTSEDVGANNGYNEWPGTPFIVTGSFLYVGGTIWNLYRMHSLNRRPKPSALLGESQPIRPSANWSLAFAPWLNPRSHAAGLQLQVGY